MNSVIRRRLVNVRKAKTEKPDAIETPANHMHFRETFPDLLVKHVVVLNDQDHIPPALTRMQEPIKKLCPVGSIPITRIEPARALINNQDTATAFIFTTTAQGFEIGGCGQIWQHFNRMTRELGSLAGKVDRKIHDHPPTLRSVFPGERNREQAFA